MKIVVTGGSGRFGQYVINELRAHNHEVLSLDRRQHPDQLVRSWIVDLAESGVVYQALVGANAVVHLAAHHRPDLTDECHIFGDNVSITYNVLQAACDLGLNRVVIAGSHDVYGFRHPIVKKVPDYLPLDEDHSCHPTEAYGLSKVVCERVADAFALRGLTTVTLRFPGINFDPTFDRLRSRRADSSKWNTHLWCYVDARDAAMACRLSLEAKLEGHCIFNIAAPNSLASEPTAELIRKYYPGVSDIRRDGTTQWSGLDSRRAERELTFKAKYTF